MAGDLLLHGANIPRFVITGSPLSGKSTLAKAIAERYDLEYISTGAIVKEIAMDWPELDAALKNGETIDSPKIDRAIIEYVKSMGIRGWILDGFPRFTGQWMKLFLASDIKIYGFLWAESIKEEALAHANTRGRDDDSAENVLRRFRWFESHTRHVYYYAMNLRICPVLNFFNMGIGNFQESVQQFTDTVQHLIPSRIHRPGQPG